MDQYLVAMLAIVGFMLFATGYFIGMHERRARRPIIDAHTRPEDIEKRVRRAF